MEDKSKDLKSSMRQKLNILPKTSSNHCIFKVPEHIRQVRRECYQPSVVSIGPIYYNNPTLQLGQELKYKSLECFLEFSARTNGTEGDSLDQYIDIVKDWEEEARSYYEEKISLSSNEFIEMMVVDATFIIYYIMCYNYDEFPSLHAAHMTTKMAWMLKLEQDLFIEDNQIPFFALSRLYNIAFSAAYPDISFKDLTCNFIGKTFIPGNDAASTVGRVKVRKVSNINHLVDFLRICCLPSKLRDDDYPENNGVHMSPSVRELNATGVTFRPSDSKNLLDVTFSAGVLHIPKLFIQENTEAILRSIIFFEQCIHYHNSYFADYAFFLDALIDTAEDVQLLVQHGIIQHCLGSDEEVAIIINRINKYILLCNPYFYYSDISKNLKAHTTTRMNKWKAVLRKDYFNHPWSIISVGYLVILLVLTVLQVYTGFKK